MHDNDMIVGTLQKAGITEEGCLIEYGNQIDPRTNMRCFEQHVFRHEGEWNIVCTNEAEVGSGIRWVSGGAGNLARCGGLFQIE